MLGFTPRSGGDAGFDAYDEFVPENVPVPGTFLEGHDVLAGREHAAFHRLTRACFEERTVYDVTFGYNLARLNLDGRHPDAGFRYAEEGPVDSDDGRTPAPDGGPPPASDDGPTPAPDDARVLRAEFTPTTEFCPQTKALTVGAFRAWNGLSERHEYDLVRVRADEMHHDSEAVDAALRALEAEFLETGSVPDGDASDGPEPPAAVELEYPGGDGVAPF